MKRFFRKLSIFMAINIIILLLLVAFDFFVVKNQFEQSYNASIIDKIQRLKSIQEPKIILVGDSNVSFGIRSELIEKELGMPVVNLGLNHGLGNTFLEEIAKQCINAGDIVIICHKTFNNKNKIPVLGTLWLTAEKHTDIWKLVTVKDKIRALTYYPIYFAKCLDLFIGHNGNKIEDSCYQRSAYNEYGDNIWSDTHYEESAFSEFIPTPPAINAICMKNTNALIEFILNKGAVLLVAGYPICVGKDAPIEKLQKDFQNFQNELQSRLNCPVISNYEDYLLDYRYFYYTDAHTNTEGAVLRTKQLIQDLKKYLAQTRITTP